MSILLHVTYILISKAFHTSDKIHLKSINTSFHTHFRHTNNSIEISLKSQAYNDEIKYTRTENFHKFIKNMNNFPEKSFLACEMKMLKKKKIFSQIIIEWADG